MSWSVENRCASEKIQLNDVKSVLEIANRILARGQSGEDEGVRAAAAEQDIVATAPVYGVLPSQTDAADKLVALPISRCDLVLSSCRHLGTSGDCLGIDGNTQ